MSNQSQATDTAVSQAGRVRRYNLVQRNGVWYRRKTINGKEDMRSTHCRDRKQAEKAAAKMDEEHLGGLGLVARKSPVLRAWYETFHEKYAKATARKAHPDGDPRILRFVDQYPDLRVNQVVTGMCEMWIAERLQQRPFNARRIFGRGMGTPKPTDKVMSPYTVRTEAMQISAVFTAAVKHKYIAINPWHDCDNMPAKSHRESYLDIEDEPFLLAELTDPDDHRGVRAIIGSGLRSEEFHLLTPRDLLKGFITVRPETAKNSKGRNVDVHETVMAIFEAQRIARRLDRRSTEPLWGHRKIHMLYHRLKAACKRGGVPALTLHDLRRTFATRLASAGFPAHMLMEQMGHSDIKITMQIYAMIQNQDKMAHLARIGSLFAPVKEGQQGLSA